MSVFCWSNSYVTVTRHTLLVTRKVSNGRSKRKLEARVISTEKACEEETIKRRRKLGYEKASKQKNTSSNEGSSYKPKAF